MKLFTGKLKLVYQSECNSDNLKFCGFPLLLFKPLSFSKYVNLCRERKKAEISINYNSLHAIESALFMLAKFLKYREIRLIVCFELADICYI